MWLNKLSWMDWFLISIQSCSVQFFYQKKILRYVKRDFPTVIFIIPRFSFNSFDGTLPEENFEFEKIVSSETKHRQPWGGRANKPQFFGSKTRGYPAMLQQKLFS